MLDYKGYGPGDIITFRKDLADYRGPYGINNEMKTFAGQRVTIRTINGLYIHIDTLPGSDFSHGSLQDYIYHPTMFAEFVGDVIPKVSSSGIKATPYDGLIKEGPIIILSSTTKLLKF